MSITLRSETIKSGEDYWSIAIVIQNKNSLFSRESDSPTELEKLVHIYKNGSISSLTESPVEVLSLIEKSHTRMSKMLKSMSL